MTAVWPRGRLDERIQDAIVLLVIHCRCQIIVYISVSEPVSISSPASEAQCVSILSFSVTFVSIVCLSDLNSTLNILGGLLIVGRVLILGPSFIETLHRLLWFSINVERTYWTNPNSVKKPQKSYEKDISICSYLSETCQTISHNILSEAGRDYHLILAALLQSPGVLALIKTF